MLDTRIKLLLLKLEGHIAAGVLRMQATWMLTARLRDQAHMDFQGKRGLVLFYSLSETSELLTVGLLTSFWLDVAAEWSTDAGDLVEQLCQR